MQNQLMATGNATASWWLDSFTFSSLSPPSFLEEEVKSNMYITTGRPIKEDFSPEVLERVRAFLRDALALRNCRWPGYECPINLDGVTHRVVAGSYYTKNSNTIYLGHDGANPIPDWLPAVLNGVIEWHCLQDEEDFARIALQMFFNNVASQARSFQRNIAQAFDGQTVVEIAINTETQQVIGKYEEESEGNSVAVWRAAYSGEVIDPDSTENAGKYFPFRMRANFLVSNLG